MIQTVVVGMRLQPRGRGQGYGLWAAYLTGTYTASLVLWSLTKHLFRKKQDVLCK